MIIYRLTILLLVFCISIGSEAADLSSTHNSKKVACQNCHINGTPGPGAAVDSNTCLSCHPKTEIVKRTASLAANPHDNHLGEIDCTLCHSGHGKSKTYCVQCHQQYDFSIK